MSQVAPVYGTRLHGSHFKDRPRPFSRAYKHKASGKLSETINSPKVGPMLENMQE